MTNNVLDVTVKACYTINIEKMRMKGVGNVENGRVQDSFFGMSFNHQMSWIDETVSHIVTHNLQPTIRAEGREAYGQKGYTHALKRIFEVIKSDQKNITNLDEIVKAERKLKDYLYDGKFSDDEMLSCWGKYTENYMNEL